MRILLVEDDAPSRRALAMLIEAAGFEVIVAKTLAEGRELLSEAPDGVIVDLLLPDGNGVEILRSIHQRRLPISVAVISAADDEMLSEAAQLRPALFGKPIDVNEFQVWLGELQKRRAEPPTQPPKAPFWN